MPQPERTAKIAAILRWLEARGRAKRLPTILEAKRYIEREVCSMGATPRTVQKYLLRCKTQYLIREHGGKLSITKDGKDWLLAHTE